jgi:hypothetical protein
MSSMRNRLVFLVLAALMVHGHALFAADFFGVTANGGGNSVTVGGSNLINLTDNLINEQGSFASLAGQNLTGAVSYGGIPNALVFTENAAQTSATITIPITGFTKTFVGTSAADLQNQIKDFLKKDGPQAYAQFLEAVNQKSAVAMLDGNPQASTALIANDLFMRFGLRNEQSTEPLSAGGGPYFGLNVNGGTIRADDLNGTWAEVSFDVGARFTDNVALSFGTAVDYRNEANSEAYTAAEEVALPITLIDNHGNGISWQVTPWGFGGFAASYDEVAGGILVGGGATSSLALHLGPITLTLGDQIDYTHGVDISYDDYAFNTNLDQWIFKNGGDVAFLFPGTPIFIDASISYSNFLRDAAIPNFWSPTAGVGITLGGHSSLKFSYAGDFGKGYNANGGQVALVLSY